MVVNTKADSCSQKILTVTELNRATSQLLADHFFTVLVVGEISNLSMPSSGHYYFSLKDASAQVRCAMFRHYHRKGMVKPENGMQVVVTAQVNLYEPRGDFQLVVEQIDEAGDGLLQKAFDALKRKLLAEGLFDQQCKSSIPLIPKSIGVITSPTGAALRDILAVLKRRFPAIPVIIYPVSVQGANAKLEIAGAIELVNSREDCDVIILARGGGSLEDLWAFNEEIVARSIFASRIPIISGVGHETDITIADFVADFRAATPTAAAEQATPDQEQWLTLFIQLEMRLNQMQQRKINQIQQSLDWLNKRLNQQHPGEKLARIRLRVNELQTRLSSTIQSKVNHKRNLIEARIAKLWQFNPAGTISAQRQRNDYLSKRLLNYTLHQMEQFNQRLSFLSQKLHSVSPLATLNRGYALAALLPSKTLLRSVDQLAIGDMTEIQLAQGRYVSQVKAVEQTGLDSDLT